MGLIQINNAQLIQLLKLQEEKQEILKDNNNNFFIHVENIKPYIAYMNQFECVTIINETTLVTYAHGTHSTLEVGNQAEVKFIDREVRSCIITRVDKTMDIIWLKLIDQTYKMSYPKVSSVYTGQFYHQIGFSSLNQYGDPLSVSNGIISCKSLDGNWHIRGTASSNLGDSGGGCFDSFTGDLLAINVGCDSIEVDGKITLEQLSSKHLAKSHLVPCNIIKSIIESLIAEY